jgi:WD40 repeat protein
MLRAALSPDGRTLVTSNADQTVRLWDLGDRGNPRQLATLADSATPRYLAISVVFSPDGRTVATAGATDGNRGVVLLWDVTSLGTPRRLATITGQFGATYEVAFAPDGRTLATVGGVAPAIPLARHEVRLWDVTDRTQPRGQAVVSESTGKIVVAFHPSGHTLVTGNGDDTLTLWDISDVGRPTSRFVLNGLTGAVAAAAFSPDGHTLATATSDHLIRIWDFTSSRQVRALTTLSGAQAAISALAFSPDGSTLATGTDNMVRLEDLADYTYATRAHGGVYGVDFSPNGRILAVGNADGTTGLWDVTDHHRVRVLADLATAEGATGPVSMVSFRFDGRSLATAGRGNLVLWDLDRTGTPAAVLGPVALGQGVGFAAMDFSPDGRTLAAGLVDGTVVLWDVQDIHRPRRRATIPGFSGTARGLTFGPDSHVLAISSGSADVTLWDVAGSGSPHELATLSPPGGEMIYTMAFSPDGRTLAVANDDHTLRLWDPGEPGRTPATIPTPVSVMDMEFSHDGSTLAAGLQDGSAQLWDVTDRNQPRTPITLTALAAGGYSVFSVAFSPTGLLATAGAYQLSSDLTARLWDSNPDEVAAHICQIARPTMTPAEWRQYFPGLAYQPPCSPAG